MFVDKNELKNLCERKSEIENLLDDDDIGPKTKDALREELLGIEDELQSIVHNNILAR